MMKLYFSPGACSLNPHIVLNEVGAPYEMERVDLKAKKTQKGEDFLKINPKGQVPTFQTEDGKILTEGAVIVQYIADKYPEKNMMPKWGTWERYKANEWLNYVATEIHKNMGTMFAVDRMITNKEGNEEFKNSMRDGLGKKFDYLSSHLSNNTFLMGSQFCAADAYLYTVLSWHAYLKLDMTKWPKLMGYMEQIQTRPAVRATLKAEGL